MGQAFIGTKGVVVAKDRHVIETDSALETKVVEELWVFDKGISEARPEWCCPCWSVGFGIFVDDTVEGHLVDGGSGRHENWWFLLVEHKR